MPCHAGIWPRPSITILSNFARSFFAELAQIGHRAGAPELLAVACLAVLLVHLFADRGLILSNCMRACHCQRPGDEPGE